MKTQIITVSLLLFAFLGLQYANAQQPTTEKREAFKQAKKAFHEDAKAYAKENILPILQAQRAKLDRELTASEQQELTAIRSELETMRQAHKEKRKAFRAQHQGELPSQRPEPTDEQIAEMRANKKEMRKLMDRAWAIADAHEANIYQLLDEMKADKEDWKADMELLKDQHLGELIKEHEGQRPIKPKHAARRGENHPRGMGHGHHKGGHHPSEMLKKVTSDPVAFLLWDGQLPERPERAELDKSRAVTVFPNPTSSTNQLQYTVEQSGLVTISLMNSDGVTLETLSSKNQKAGNYTEAFSLESLAPGTYYYKVETATERIVKRFIVE